jgi:hypothetical protein
VTPKLKLFNTLFLHAYSSLGYISVFPNKSFHVELGGLPCILYELLLPHIFGPSDMRHLIALVTVFCYILKHLNRSLLVVPALLRLP